MKVKVVKKHENSRDCFVCGLENPSGLKASFYELKNQELVCVFTAKEEHQSYPGRVHGGVSGAVLDETIGRAISVFHENTFGVTVELSVQYKKPVPVDTELRCVGRITKDRGRIFEGSGEILLPNGEVAATATGKYMRLPLEKISESAFSHEEWFVATRDEDPEYIVF